MTSLLMSEDHRTRTLMSPALFLIAKERPKAEVAWSKASSFCVNSLILGHNLQTNLVI